MAKIIHYRDKCIGCGICYELQPEFWIMSKKDGKAILLHGTAKKEIYSLTIASAERERSQFIAKACPVNIIKITDEKRNC